MRSLRLTEARSAELVESGSVSRSGSANKTRLGSPETLLAAEPAAGHRPALRFGSGCAGLRHQWVIA